MNQVLGETADYLDLPIAGQRDLTPRRLWDHLCDRLRAEVEPLFVASFLAPLELAAFRSATDHAGPVLLLCGDPLIAENFVIFIGERAQHHLRDLLHSPTALIEMCTEVSRG